ncbi:MAG: thermonuclease family protein [Deltaproteobacteria bacterium]|nr:thermonuclease family protein [Deltaproteobacteria bacterium]
MIKKLLWSFLVFFCISTLAYAWSGECVGISDGDTIKVMHQGMAERIRLYGIDCPEKKQASGKRAKQFTAGIVFKQIVEIKPVMIDRYGRTIAWVNVNGMCLNEELLKAGLAWHYKRYSFDKNLSVLEITARQNKLGLWNDSNPIPPWNFRRGDKTTINQTTNKKVMTLVRADAEVVVYHGNYSSKKFHRPGCRYYNCSKCTVLFQSRDEAIQAGYKPCKICNP